MKTKTKDKNKIKEWVYLKVYMSTIDNKGRPKTIKYEFGSKDWEGLVKQVIKYANEHKEVLLALLGFETFLPNEKGSITTSTMYR